MSIESFANKVDTGMSDKVKMPDFDKRVDKTNVGDTKVDIKQEKFNPDDRKNIDIDKKIETQNDNKSLIDGQDKIPDKNDLSYEQKIEKQDGKEGLTDKEKEHIKNEIGWSDEIIDNIENMDQYEVLKKAGLKEVEINDRKCLVKENINLDYEDEDGLTNRQRIELGLAPLDESTGKPLELHHLGQKADSPLVELTEEEHRTGEYKDGKKNQSLWHNNSKETEVHGEGNNWDKERKEHWKTRVEGES